MNKETLSEFISSLGSTDKLWLYQLLKGEFEYNEESKFFEQLRTTRFAEGARCPHCSGTSVKKNGSYKINRQLRQRYLCKDCQRTFNDFTGTPMAGTHHPEKWVMALMHMIEGNSLRTVASGLGINIQTAFYWRHKMLRALTEVTDTEVSLSGVVEADETYIQESFKGKKSDLPREPRKRGAAAKKRGISKEKSCVLVAVDRAGDIYSKYICKGRPCIDDVEKALAQYLAPNTILVTDSNTSYPVFAKRHNLQHFKVNPSKNIHKVSGIYHVQHVNGYHSRLKGWMRRFKGVATKHLDHYLCWFRLLEKMKRMRFAAKRDTLVLTACKTMLHTKTTDFPLPLAA